LEEEKGEIAMSDTNIIAEPGRQEIIVTRVFDAPRELVFKAYTDPRLMTQWWSPRKYTVEVGKMDVRPGGTWRIDTRDADGNDYWFHGVYHDISPPDRIVQTFEFEGMPGHVSLETATFEDVDGKTKVTARSVFQTVEDRDGMLQSMEAEPAEVMNEVMDRLAELLQRLQKRISRAA
jgi:uncharacterized protein YndB with AHSA1/START domain